MLVRRRPLLLLFWTFQLRPNNPARTLDASEQRFEKVNRLIPGVRGSVAYVLHQTATFFNHAAHGFDSLLAVLANGVPSVTGSTERIINHRPQACRLLISPGLHVTTGTFRDSAD